jgi:hypothetical protein
MLRNVYQQVTRFHPNLRWMTVATLISVGHEDVTQSSWSDTESTEDEFSKMKRRIGIFGRRHEEGDRVCYEIYKSKKPPRVGGGW